MSSRPLAPVVEHLPDGIGHVALPTPFPVGPVNCYVLIDEPVTVVDSGLLCTNSTTLLEGTLRGVGLRLADVDQVLVTHCHPDHFGAAGWLAEVADATVICARADRPKLMEVLDRTRLAGVIVRRTALRSAASWVASLVLPAPGGPQVRIKQGSLTVPQSSSSAGC